MHYAIKREGKDTILFSFYDKKDRDTFLDLKGGENITYKDKRKLSFIGTGFTLVFSDTADHFVYFAKHVML